METLHVNQVIHNNEIVEYVTSQLDTGESKDQIIEKLLGIGVAVITRVQSSRDVDFVKKESQKIITSFDNTVSRLEAELMKQVSVQINHFFNPDAETSHSKKFAQSLEKNLGDFKKEIVPIIQNVKQLSSEKIEGFDKKITLAQDNLNPELEGSYFGKMRSIISQVDQGLANQLDDTRVGSFAYRLKEETEKLFGKDSPIINTITKVIDDKTKSFEGELIQLRESIAKSEGKEEGMQEAMDKSTAKGRRFEEELMDYLLDLAKPFNDIVEFTGDISADGSMSKKGDFIYTFSSGQTIIIEAKDSNTLGYSAAIKYLNKAMIDRAVSFSILVHKNESQLSNQVDCMGFFEDNKVITSQEYLRFAIQWSRIFLSKAEDKMAEGVNETLVLQRISDITSKLKMVRSMKSTLSSMRNNVGTSCDKVSNSIDELKNEITEYLNDIENEFIKLNSDSNIKEQVKLAS